MYEEIFAGYRMNSGLDVTFSENTDAIVAKDIQFYSMCEHHMLPFYGKIHIAYIPSSVSFDNTKLTYVVEKYARRLQIQERLTRQIADEIIGMRVKGVSVIVKAKHLCMKMRGVIVELWNKSNFENMLILIYTPAEPKLRSVL